MVDKVIAEAAVKAKVRRGEFDTTVAQLRARLQPRQLISDLVAKLQDRSVKSLRQIKTAPTARKGALVGAGVAAVATIAMRGLYRTEHEDTVTPHSPEPVSDVTRLG